jgi:flagellar assembly protein FliH
MPLLRDSSRAAGVTGVALDLGDLRRQGQALREHAHREADAIIAAARAERDRLIADAAQTGLAQGLEQGRAQGRREGLEAGRAEALREAGPRLRALESAWAQALDEFSRARDRLHAEAGRELVTLALEIARRVIRRSLEADPSLVEEQVRAVLAQVARPARVVLWVHPDDGALVRAALPKVAGALGAGTGLELRADAALERGSCRLTTPSGGCIDASIGVQIDRIAGMLVPAGGGR